METEKEEINNKIINSFTLYLDETGDHLLYSEEEYIKNPDLESHCSLMGFIVPDNNKNQLKKEMSELKKYFWRTDDVVLHSVEIRHRKGLFAIFHYGPKLYDEFKIKIIEIIKSVKPKIVCSSLDKRTWIKRYPRKWHFKDDPYEQAFIFLLEKYAWFLNTQSGENVVGKISLEKRTPEKDRAIKKAYFWTINNGTQYKNKDYFKKLSRKIDFKDKRFNIAGSQLSDYCSYPFYVNHKYPERDNKLYSLLSEYIHFHKKWPV
ncbi:MAG: hypothetical protein QG583_25 [Patescibacteria group bacterium]|nr:hypothetical protein [Patescibacteria group bacterium]